jgi:hypothetical protein
MNIYLDVDGVLLNHDGTLANPEHAVLSVCGTECLLVDLLAFQRNA